MLNLKKLAVTGSLASGKSSVCSYFRDCGAYVVSSDLILHNAFDQNKSLKRTLVQILGETILEYGSISRKRVADIVFSNRELLHAIEIVCHDYLFQALQIEFEKARSTKNVSLFVAEVPLLYETPNPILRSWFDVTLYVSAPLQVRKARYVQLGRTEEDFTCRNARFLPEEKKQKLADFCIENVGNKNELQEKVFHIFQQIQR